MTVKRPWMPHHGAFWRRCLCLCLAACSAGLASAWTNRSAADTATVAQVAPQPAPLSERHGHLALLAGEWHINVSIVREPGGHPDIFDGTAVRTLTLGGRVLEERTTMSNGDGVTVEAVAQYGYDAVADQVWMTWVDTTATGIAVFRGHYDADEDVTFLQGQIYAPGGEGPADREVESYMIDENRQFLEFTGPVFPSGQRIRTRSIVYSRN